MKNNHCPFIINVSMREVMDGITFNCDFNNTILIQIVDPNMEFPTPKNKYLQIYKFKFFDDNGENVGLSISENQIDEIFNILNDCLSKKINIIVHCVAGICRSGAITEIGTIIGFKDLKRYNRLPNVHIKNLFMRKLYLENNS